MDFLLVTDLSDLENFPPSFIFNIKYFHHGQFFFSSRVKINHFNLKLFFLLKSNQFKFMSTARFILYMKWYEMGSKEILIRYPAV